MTKLDRMTNLKNKQDMSSLFSAVANNAVIKDKKILFEDDGKLAKKLRNNVNLLTAAGITVIVPEIIYSKVNPYEISAQPQLLEDYFDAVNLQNEATPPKTTTTPATTTGTTSTKTTSTTTTSATTTPSTTSGVSSSSSKKTIVPVGSSNVNSVANKSTVAAATAITTTTGFKAKVNDRWCDSGNHRDDNKCVSNTDHCDEYNAATHNCTDCAWYSFAQKNPNTGNYCKTSWWKFLLWGLLGLLALFALLGLLACCLCKKKKAPVEKIPLVEKPRYVEPKVEKIKQATPPRRVITPKREKVVEKVIVLKSPPKPVEKHYMPENRKVVYGEKHERTVYGEPRYYTVGTTLRESHVIDEKPVKVYDSPDRIVTSTRVVKQEPVVTQGETRVIRGEPRVIQGETRVVRGEPTTTVTQGATRVVTGEPRVIQGETRVVQGESYRPAEVTRTVVGGNTSNAYSGERVVMTGAPTYTQSTRVVGGGGNTVVGGGTTYGTSTVGNAYGNTVSYGNDRNAMGGSRVNRY